MKVRRELLAAACALAVPAFSYADISGFSGFAPVNKYQNSVVSTNAAIGYSSDFSTFTVTDNNNSEQTSGYFATPQDITSFTATFTYKAVYGVNGSSNRGANGIGLIIQNDAAGTTLLKSVGNADAMTIAGTTKSAGYIFNDYGGVDNYAGSTYVSTGGSTVSPGTTSLWQSISPVNLSTKDPMQVTLQYTNGTLRQTIVDTVTGATYHNTRTGLNISSQVASGSALVGIVGTTGGFNSLQTVSNFSFRSGTGVPVLPAVSSTAVFAPIALSGGFNQTMIVPANAGTAGNGAGYLTATMDNGTNISIVTGTGYTFFEKGLGGAPTGTGLPASGSTFTSATDSRHTFTMPTYDGDFSGRSDAMMLSTNSASGTLSFTKPGNYSAISVLASAGNGPVPVSVQINYADGTSADVGDISVKDWFFNTPYAFSAGARADTYNNAFNQSTGNVNLYQFDVNLPTSNKKITGVTFGYDGAPGVRSVAAIFALSGVAFNPLLAGDLNFDGNVDDSDTAAFILATVDEQSYINTYVPADIRSTFTDTDFKSIADFNYDGNVDDSDTAAFIQATVNGSFPPPPGGSPAPSFSAAVPEPTSAVGVLAVAAVGSLSRRRRR